MERQSHPAIAIASRATGSAMQLAANFLIAAFMGPVAVAAYNVFQSWLYTLGALASFGLPLAAYKQELHSGVSFASVERIKTLERMAILAGAAVAIASVYVVVKLDNPDSPNVLRNVIWPLAVALPAYCALRMKCEVLKARNRISVAFLIEFTLPPSVVCSVAILSKYLNLSFLEDVIWGWTGSLWLTWAVLLWPQHLDKIVSKKRADFADRNETGGSELAYMWMAVVGYQAAAALPYIVMPFLISVSQIGFFAIAHRLVGAIATIVGAMTVAYLPRLVRSQFIANVSSAAVVRTATIVGGTNLMLLAGIALFSETFLALINLNGDGANFRTTLLILCLARAISGWGVVIEQTMILTNRAHFETISTVLSSSVFLIVLFFGTNVDMKGCAIALGVSWCVKTFISCLLFFIHKSWRHQ